MGNDNAAALDLVAIARQERDELRRRLIDHALNVVRLFFGSSTTPRGFLDVSRVEILEFVPFGRAGWVAVIGDPSNGAYEWFLRRDVLAASYRDVEHSNACYGSTAHALRDGLNAALV